MKWMFSIPATIIACTLFGCMMHLAIQARSQRKEKGPYPNYPYLRQFHNRQMTMIEGIKNCQCEEEWINWKHQIESFLEQHEQFIDEVIYINAKTQLELELLRKSEFSPNDNK